MVQLCKSSKLIRAIRPVAHRKRIAASLNEIRSKQFGKDIGELYQMVTDLRYWSFFHDRVLAKAFALAILDCFESAGPEVHRLSQEEIGNWNNVFEAFIKESKAEQLQSHCRAVYGLLRAYAPALFPPHESLPVLPF